MQALEINISEVLHISIKTETETSWLQEDVYREVPNEGQKPFQTQMVVSSKVIDNVTSAKARLFAKEFEEHTACTPSPFCWVGVVGG